MTFNELEKRSLFFYPAVLLEKTASSSLRRMILKLLGLATFILAWPAGLYLLVNSFPAVGVKLAGLFLVSLSLWFVIFSLQAFFYSYYFGVLDIILGGSGTKDTEPISFEVALLIDSIAKEDITGSFLSSSFGKKIVKRLGITERSVDIFIRGERGRINEASFFVESLDGEYGITLTDFALALFNADRSFKKFLAENGVGQSDLKACAFWIVRENRREKRLERWWSRDSLGRVKGIGKDWGYGEVYYLEHFAKRIIGRGKGPLLPMTALKDELHSLESILAKNREANAILVGEPGGGASDIVTHLGRLIQDGTILPTLEHKRLIVLDTDKLVAETKTKSHFEEVFLKMMDQTSQAGNIIVVFDNFSSFMENAAVLGSNAPSLLDPYLASADIQFIAITSSDRFHSSIEKNSALMSRFESIFVRGEDQSAVVSVLQDEAIDIEMRTALFFTYPAILSIADGADRFISEGVMPDKAIDLLDEITPIMIQARTFYVTKEEVEGFLKTRTGIPVGKAGQAEREILLNLEEFLKKRVVGQDEAIKAVSGALRRARSGIGNPRKPIGSFLFMGPTGVGKTETAKALAEAFFGGESNIIRFDMSEYKGVDSLDKLIGSFTSGRSGVLTARLKEKPYGVLLLDEFEKADKDVLDLFLQILDEGSFSDMSGKKVNARNLIIIATSNAGAEKIWGILKDGKNLTDEKGAVMDFVVNQNIFRPELLNRFDGVIFFHPIVNENLRRVSEMMLKRLSSRLREKGIELKVTEALVDYLMKFGNDPKFGARPMARAIQDKVEQIIADKILKGEIKPGDEIELTEKDFG